MIKKKTGYVNENGLQHVVAVGLAWQGYAERGRG
jgi:hypothetical protein